MIQLSVVLRSVAIFCCSLAVAASLPAQSFLHRYRSPTNSYFCDAIRPLPQQRIVIGGSALAAAPDRASISMFDGVGNVLWNRSYGGQLAEASGVFDFAALPDGNFLALIGVISGAGQSFTHLSRIDAQNGQLLGALQFSNTNLFSTYSHITKAPDGFVACGKTSGTITPQAFTVMKLDQNGNVQWQRSVQRSDLAGQLSRVIVAENGDIWAVTAFVNPIGVSATGAIGLFQFNAGGDLLKVFQYRATDAQRLLGINSIAWVPGKGPLLGGWYYVNGPSQIQPMMIQCDLEGNVLWSTIFNTQPSAYIDTEVFSLQSGDLFAACGSGGAPNLGFISKIDPQQGAVKWARDFSANDGIESLFTAVLDENDHLFATGQVFSPLPNLEAKILLFRTDEALSDTAGCCTRPIPMETSAIALTRELLTFSAGNVVAPQPSSFSGNPIVLQRQDVCGAPNLPEVVWADTAVCPGECITLRINPPGGSYNLQVNGASPSNTTITDSVEICFPEADIYVVQISAGACARSSKNLEVKQQFPGPFTASDTLICPGECITFTPPAGTRALQWVFAGAVPDTFAGAQPPEVCYSEAGTYPVRLILQGCGDRTRNIAVSALPFQIPNAFTPNADDLNDVFRPLLECPDGDFLFEVYNRWGQKVYSANNPDAGWDGNHEQEPAPMDVYVWKLEFGARNASGQSERRSAAGHVTLIR
jgi:gliding motility-associated-like protein